MLLVKAWPIEPYKKNKGSFPCDKITIDYSNPMKIFVYKYTGPLEQIYKPPLEDRDRLDFKEIPNLYDIQKYETSNLEIINKSEKYGNKGDSISTEDLSKLMSFMEALPNWWMKSIIEVRLQVCGRFPSVTFCSRFHHLKQMIIRLTATSGDTALSYVNELVRGASRVDLFAFEVAFGLTIRFGDEILETIMRKSWIYPTSIPMFRDHWPLLSLEQIIRFLELNTFVSKIETNCIRYLAANVRGNLEDWKEWLRRNTVPAFSSHNEFFNVFLFRGQMYRIQLLNELNH